MLSIRSNILKLLFIIFLNQSIIHHLFASNSKCAQAIKKINKVDAKALITNAFSICLSEYIQLKTIAPRGDEYLAVEYLSNIFKSLKIPYHTYKLKNQNHARVFIEQLSNVANDPSLKIKLINGWNHTQSSIESTEYNALVKGLKKSHNNKNVVVAPALFPAGSDSNRFRAPYFYGVNDIKPIPSYGYPSLAMTSDISSGFHGANERFPVSESYSSVKRYFFALESILQLGEF